MCTLSLIPRHRGFLLGMNRDESIDRDVAIPPQRRALNGISVIYPSEPTGGTWIAVNEFGNALALVNWYAIQHRAGRNSISRGVLIPAIGDFSKIEQVENALTKQRLQKINPFRLVAISLQEETVSEWRWDREQLSLKTHSWKPTQWISSGFDEPKAQRIRKRIFQKARLQKSTDTAEWLRRLHRSHSPERGAFSHCVHRDDAKSVSYTEISVSGNRVRMRYLDGSPCENVPVYNNSLNLP